MIVNGCHLGQKKGQDKPKRGGSLQVVKMQGGAAYSTLAFTLFSTTGLVVIDNAFENLSHSV